MKKRKNDEASDETLREGTPIEDISTLVEAGPSVDEGSKVSAEERDKRTLFIGNLPVCMNRNRVRTLAGKWGAIESVRLRSIATEGVKVSESEKGNQALVKKVAANLGKLSGARDNFNAYVVYVEEVSVSKAIEEGNGVVIVVLFDVAIFIIYVLRGAS